MSIPGRLKGDAGGDVYPVAKNTVPSATALVLLDWTNVMYVSGTTTVSTLSMPSSLRNRRITLIGAAGAAVQFTNTDTLTTAGQMYLRGSNRLLLEDTVIDLFVKADGTAILICTTTA